MAAWLLTESVLIGVPCIFTSTWHGGDPEKCQAGSYHREFGLSQAYAG